MMVPVLPEGTHVLDMQRGREYTEGEWPVYVEAPCRGGLSTKTPLTPIVQHPLAFDSGQKPRDGGQGEGTRGGQLDKRPAVCEPSLAVVTENER